MSYFKNRHKYRLILHISIILLLAVMLISNTMGIADIGIFDSLKIIVSRIPMIGKIINRNTLNNTNALIVLDIRMPRIILSASIGALLASIGGCFQGLFRNPMADPYVLGISNGAGLSQRPCGRPGPLPVSEG
jgi:iron complex transport system permease protein